MSDINETININRVEFESNPETPVFQLTLSKEILNKIKQEDKNWGINFKKYVDQENQYPYIMSPQTTTIISEIFNQALKTFRENFRWDVKRWFGEREAYVLGVMRRVIIPDTYEPIFYNTGKVAEHLKTLNGKNQKCINIRSFFTGAAVADKSLLIQLKKLGVGKINLISTDYSAESLILAAINLEIWNSSLSEENKFKIFIVDGNIPKELYLLENAIILQVRDALYAVTNDLELWEKDPQYRIDVVLLDNALPYVPREFGVDLVKKSTVLKGVNGLYIAILGLDKGIHVSINVAYQLKEIIKGGCQKRYHEFLSKHGFNTAYGYLHYYNFKSVGDDYYIDKVVSLGAARVYDWLHDLLYSFKFAELSTILKAIKSATSLSKASNIIKTSPIETHDDLIKLFEDQKFKYEIYASPTDKRYYKEKGIDPVVLRTSLFYIN